MIIGVGLDQRLGFPIGDYADLANEATRLGFESIWTNSMAVPDAFHVCSAWSTRTASLTGTATRTGIAVIPAPKNWRLDSLANQAATLGMISQGNFVLGIGTGGAGPAFWESAGMPNRPIAVMRDFVTVLRSLFAGDEVTYNGPALQLNRVRLDKTPQEVPVYLAALGPQMLRLAGEAADGACLNWATPEQIAWSDEHFTAGATAAGRNRSDLKLTMYIRVCIDDDVVAARKAFGIQVLGYGLARGGVDPALGYRGHFARMGFDDLFVTLEQQRADGVPLGELVDLVPDEFLNMLGYFGPADGAPERFAKLSVGLDEALVRVITARPGTQPVIEAMEALTPAKIRAATA